MILRFSIDSNSGKFSSLSYKLKRQCLKLFSSVKYRINIQISLAGKFDKNKNNRRNHGVLYLKWPLLWAWTALVNCCELALGSFDCSSKRPNIPFPLASIKSMQSWLSEKEIFFTPRPSFSYKSCSSLRILWLKNCCNFSLQ